MSTMDVPFVVGDPVRVKRTGRQGFVRQIRHDKIGTGWTVWPRGRGVPTGYVEIAVGRTMKTSRLSWYRPEELEAARALT